MRGQRSGEWTAVAAVVGGVVAGFGDGTGGQRGSRLVQQQSRGIAGQKFLCLIGFIVPEIPDALCVLQDGDLRRGGAGTFRQAQLHRDCFGAAGEDAGHMEVSPLCPSVVELVFSHSGGAGDLGALHGKQGLSGPEVGGPEGGGEQVQHQ